MMPLLLAAVAFLPMLVEARRSATNEARLRKQGAVEPGGDVYPLMQVAYPASFAIFVAAAASRPRVFDRMFIAGAGVFLAGKLIKYWAIASLGPRWTFRVLVVPGAALVHSGPYAYARHPNYVGVVGELCGMALMARAPLVVAVVTVAAFGGLLAARIRVEERALRDVSSVRVDV